MPFMRFLSCLLLCLSWAAFPMQDVRETLAECRRNLSPESPVEIRRSAVLVLGKYSLPEVAPMLGECLSDPDAGVRRNALVSLLENPTQMLSQMEAVVPLLADGDVHIRRMASSALAEYGGFLRQGKGKGEEELRTLLIHGLEDQDSEVRRNTLAALTTLDYSLPLEKMVRFLEEPSPEIVALAIPAVLSAWGTPERKCTLLEALVGHPNIRVRAILAQELWRVPEGMPLLRRLSEDEAPPVRAAALESRCRLGDASAELASSLRAELLREECAEREELFATLMQKWPGEARHLALETVSAKTASASFQECCWRQIVSHTDWQKELPTMTVAEALAQNGGASRMRMSLVALLRKRAAFLSEAELAVLQGSPSPECRKAVLELLAKMPAKLRENALEEALLDDEVTVRQAAVERLAALRPAGCSALLLATLEAPEAPLQIAAARAFVRNPDFLREKEVRDGLRQWLPQCPDAALRKQLEGMLKNKK